MNDVPLEIAIHGITQEFKQGDLDFQGRVIRWSIAAAISNGTPEEIVFRVLENRPVEGQWWIVRQILPEEALRSLYGKISSQRIEVKT